MVRPYGLDDEDQPFEQTWGIPQAPPKPISSFKPVPQPESAGLAPKINTGSAPPNLSQFGSPAPPKSILGTDVAPGEQISDKQMPKAEHLAENPKDAENFQAHQERSNTLRDFGQKDADIRGQIISLDPHTPDYLKKLGELHAAQGAIQEEKAHFERGTPWGSAGNHPGVFGKIGHVLGEIGNVAGQALAPGLTEAIPGSQLNLEEQERSGRAQEKFGSDLANSEAKAAAAATTADAHVTSADAAKQKSDTLAASQPKRDEALDRQTTLKEQALSAQAAADIAHGGDVNDPAMQRIVPAAQSLMKPAAEKTPPHITAMGPDGKPHIMERDPDTGAYSIDRGIAPPNATTQPQVPILVPGETPGSATMRVIHPGQSFDATNAINPSQLTATNKSVVAEQGSMNSIKSYQQDYHQNRPHLTPADVEALKVITSHSQAGIAQHLIQDAGSGVLDALVGQPFTGYTQKLMQGTMTADQYNQMSPAAQKMLFGYTHAIVANFVNMKQKLGSIGRNPDQIQAEMANIPVPYIDPNAADQAFTRTIRDADNTTFNPFGGSKPPASNAPAPPTGIPSFAEWKKSQQGAH